MAMFNVTNARVDNSAATNRNFMTSNENIHIDTLQLKISELQITEQEWLGNF